MERMEHSSAWFWVDMDGLGTTFGWCWVGGLGGCWVNMAWRPYMSPWAFGFFSLIPSFCLLFSPLSPYLLSLSVSDIAFGVCCEDTPFPHHSPHSPFSSSLPYGKRTVPTHQVLWAFVAGGVNRHIHPSSLPILPHPHPTSLYVCCVVG